MEVTIDFGGQGACAVIVVQGDLDVHHVTEFRQTVHSVLSVAGNDAVVDVRRLRLLDDAAQAALLHLERQCREFGGALRGAEGLAVPSTEMRVGVPPAEAV